MKIINISSEKIFNTTERIFLNYNEALSLNGHKVFAIYNRSSNLTSKFKTLKNVKYLPLFFTKPLFLIFPFLFLLFLSINPDLIILQDNKNISLFFFLGKILKIPVILVYYKSPIKIAKKAPYIFCTTEEQKQYFIINNIKKEKIFIIPNFLTKSIPFKEFQSFSTPPIFGITGRFIYSRGFTTIIKACSKLKMDKIDFKLQIYGVPKKENIKEYQKIKNLIKLYNLEQNIELKGFVKNKKNIFSNIDIFVLPLKEELFSITMIEAMMYSIPTIISDIAATKNINEKNQITIEFNSNSYTELAEKMEFLINNKDTAKKITKNAYQLVNKEYILDKIAKDIDSAIKKITKKQI